MLENCQWIWFAGEQTEKNIYGAFRKIFEIAEIAPETVLNIAADSNYTVWINGNRMKAGQFSDYSQHRTYSTINIASFLQPGKNVIAVRVHFIGEEFATYTAGKPGLIAEIQAGETVLCSTDITWKARQDRAFGNGPICKVSLQLGYTFLYDARLEEPWQTPDYDDAFYCKKSGIGGI